MANAGVVTATRDAAPDAWRRLVGYLIQAFAAEAAQPLPDPPTHRPDVPSTHAANRDLALATVPEDPSWPTACLPKAAR